ncbi:MAG TPA: radical SAM protein [Gemmatimonadaceae bacterium]|nr:radical SAM protein [Gemmatimonadaceae bacterium]
MRSHFDKRQLPLLDDTVARLEDAALIGVQGDIRYYGIRVKNILNSSASTGMGFSSINVFIGCAFSCAYCYARYAHRWALDRKATENPDLQDIRDARDTLPPWLAFERRIFVKQNAADALRKVLRHGSDKHFKLLDGESIVIGTATDPFQPAERRFRITRSVLEVLAEHAGLSICIITKSPLITRDIDVLKRIHRNSSLSVHLSLITTDRELARRLEPRAPTPESRLRALARLREADIETGINVMPVLPAITDDPASLERLVMAVGERGASYLNTCPLGLRSSARARYLPFIEREFPHLARRYRATYAFDHKVSESYSERLRELVGGLCEKHGVRFGRWGRNEKRYEAEAIEERFAGAAASDQLNLEL